MKSKKQDFLKALDVNQGIITSLCKVYYSSKEDQKDAFQDIVLQLWKSFGSFRGQSQIGTWIYKVSLNTILAKIRKNKRRVKTEPLGKLNKPIVLSGADGDMELLQIIIQSLKELDKAIIILYLEGYKNKEISQILNITPTHVSTRLNRVRRELKSKFKYCSYEFKQS